MAATRLRIYQDVIRHLGDARLSLITDDVESRYALDDAWDEGVAFVLRQAPWRFALITATLAASAGPIPGFARRYARPTDWLRTHAIHLVQTDGRECPLDLREQGIYIFTNSTVAPTMRYVSALCVDPLQQDASWPEHFAQCVAAYLAFLVAERVTGERAAPAKMSQLFASLLPEAMAIDAVPEDRWLRYQRDGSFLRASQTVMSRGFWQWAIKTLDIDSSMQETTSPQPGFPYRYAFPSDFVQSHSLYVAWDGLECPINIRETGFWSTDAAAWTARYMSTDAYDATQWPEVVMVAIMAYLDWQYGEPEGKENAQEEQVDGAVFEKLLADAMRLHSIPKSDWLDFQLDGSYIQAVKMMLERGRWRFAVKTVSIDATTFDTTGTVLTADDGSTELTADDGSTVLTADGATAGGASDANAFSDGSVSPGYAFRLPKPLDWMRTLRLYRSLSDGLYPNWWDVDFRDELGALHANWSPLKLRYVSRLGLDATQWPMNFRDAVLAWCQYCAMRGDPKMAAVAAKKLEFYQLQCREAETLDDERDVPRVLNSGRFVSARYGRSNYSREQGWRSW